MGIHVSSRPPIFYGQWKWDSQSDRFRNTETGFEVSATVVHDRLVNLRTVNSSVILDILNKLEKEYDMVEVKKTGTRVLGYEPNLHGALSKDYSGQNVGSLMKPKKK